ncbi:MULTISPECIES: OadG-related small transporter subunit [unclassified Sedimentibacter]|nr:OadG-related small transporter subunit [Sedimentibacter sp. MB35-C1]WMJ77757.1 OadG-related small transporter subunit [Sedimentibacter sp. MB35-C1]
MNINIENVMNSLELMGMGMSAIFLVIIVIYASVSIMLKLTAQNK